MAFSQSSNATENRVFQCSTIDATLKMDDWEKIRITAKDKMPGATRNDPDRRSDSLLVSIRDSTAPTTVVALPLLWTLPEVNWTDTKNAKPPQCPPRYLTSSR